MTQPMFPADINGIPAHAATVTTLYGDTVSGTLSGLTLHDWTADGDGKFHTSTDLGAEWRHYHDMMMAGLADQLTGIQRLEGNAEVVFENTGLAKLSAAEQARDREDVQREYDAIDAAMKIDQQTMGIDPTKPLTLNAYIAIERTIEATPALQELALQGHGLNNPPAPKYAGYTNDFQNNVDGKTLYIGGGLDNNQNALAAFFDDVVLSHEPFSVVYQNGHLEQLNQNGDAEDHVDTAVIAFDDAMFNRVYSAADFSVTVSSANNAYIAPVTAYVEASMTTAATGAGQMSTLYGDVVARTLDFTPHRWVADGNGLYHTTTDLAAEWKGFYVAMLSGQGASLTAIQRMEGNAEAVFENTGLSKLSAARLKADREDVQREYDAMAVALQRDAALGYDPAAPFAKASYLAMERAIWTDPTLKELANQGHGLNNPPALRYRGYTNDFQNGVDGKTLFVGGGLDNNENALTAFFDDVVLGHAPFPTVYQNGHLEQLNQNGNAEDRLEKAIIAADDAAYGRVFTASDFAQTASTAHAGYVSPFTAAVDASMFIRNDMHEVPTLDGNIIADTMTVNGHVWMADAFGQFHTTAALADEWQAAYRAMLAGNGGSLTPTQRQEGNAEAVFENTGFAKLSAADQARDREDAQREFDAIAAAIQIDQVTYGIDPTKALTLNAYIDIGRTLQSTPALEELAVQGHGLNNPPAVRYRGYTNDFQNNVDQTTLFVGGGLNFNEKAIADLFDDSIISHLPFPVVWQNGQLIQLNQNGANENTAEAGVVALDDTMFGRVYRATDFSTTAASGVDTYISPFQAMVHASMAPVVGAGQIATLYGDVIADTITITPHVWTADSTGLFHTTADLAAEWKGYYATMLAGQGASLTAWQRLEGNAEAVFENTGLSRAKLLYQRIYREDIQRSIDAMAGAMAINQATLGIDASKPMFLRGYEALEHTIQKNAALQELALQGHGLASPPASRYRGYLNDFQYTTDSATRYVGGGIDEGQSAVTNFMADAIVSNTGFATIEINGHRVQLNQSGRGARPVGETIAALNAAMFNRTYAAADFRKV